MNSSVFAQNSPDPLPSWNEGTVKQKIREFVETVSDSNNPNYVPLENRIATFDNDGTLWVEKPLYIQVYFLLERLKELAPEHPEWQTQEPFKSVLAKEYDSLTEGDLITLVMATHSGITQAKFDELARKFFETAKHPRFGTLYKNLTYKPMVELLEYLRSKGFTTYICTGGGMDFVRLISQENYGISPELVIGSNILKKYELTPSGTVLNRLPEIVPPINDKEGKPVNIDRHIGKKPLLAFGNSDGDIAMLEYTTVKRPNTLGLLLHHDDQEREYSYDKRTEKALVEAKTQGWLIVSMKNDFKQIFAQN